MQSGDTASGLRQVTEAAGMGAEPMAEAEPAVAAAPAAPTAQQVMALKVRGQGLGSGGRVLGNRGKLSILTLHRI